MCMIVNIPHHILVTEGGEDGRRKCETAQFSIYEKEKITSGKCQIERKNEKKKSYQSFYKFD
jgi:hypothetical protein